MRFLGEVGTRVWMRHVNASAHMHARATCAPRHKKVFNPPNGYIYI